jgi:hypothetical protein
MPEPADLPKPEKPAITPAATAPDEDSNAPGDSGKDGANELLVAICSAIFGRIAPVAAGIVKQGRQAELLTIDEGFMWLRLMPEQMSGLLGSGATEADMAAAVALFPAGVRALIATRVDVRIRVSRSKDGLAVSILQCSEPAFLLNQLSEPYEATHALHLVCDSNEDTGHTFVMVEFSGGQFTPKGWLDHETAAQCAAEGAKRATGRAPDFRGTTGKSPR